MSNYSVRGENVKGVNLKKIGAILAGTAILAGSLAFAAPLVYQNVELVNNNGQPVAKVVVGSNAAVSDAVAASKIAQYLANNAFVQKTYTAQVEGADQLSCSVSGGENAASCSVSDESVTLQVTIPGQTSKAVASFGLLIGEQADRNVGDRDGTDYYSYLRSFDDEKANPFQDTAGGVLTMDGTSSQVSTANYAAYKIDSSNFEGFAPVTVKNSASVSATEYQRVYAGVYTKYASDEIKARGDSIVYQLYFDGYGLPLCPGDTSKTLGTCENGSTVENARYQIYFAGEPWVITHIDKSGDVGANLTKDGQVFLAPTDFEIDLAKESVYGSLDLGTALPTPDGKYYVVPVDIDKRSNSAAIIYILDAQNNNETIKKVMVSPGDTQKVSLPNGDSLKIHVYQTAGGYQLIGKYVELAVIKDEIQLKSGEKFLNTNSNIDSKYKTYVELAADKGDNLNVSDAKYLKALTFVADSSIFGMTSLEPGDSVNVLDVSDGNHDFRGYELVYKGLDTSGISKDALSFNYQKSGDYTITYKNVSTGEDLENGVHLTQYVQISSEESNAFSYNNGEAEGNSILLVTKTDKKGYDLGTNATTGGKEIYLSDTVLLNDGGDYYPIGATYSVNVSGGTSNTTLDAGDTLTVPTIEVDYNTAGDHGKLYIVPSTNLYTLTSDDLSEACTNATAPGDCIITPKGLNYTFEIVEDIGPVNGSSDSATGIWDFDLGRTAGKFYDNASAGNAADDEGVLYSANGSYNWDKYGYSSSPESYDTGFISPRGSVFSDASSTTRVFEIPSKVEEALFEFKSTNSNTTTTSEGTTETWTMHEGDEKQAGDVTIKVQSIDETATPTVSGTGAAGASVSGKENLKAYIVSQDGSEKTQSLTASVRVPVTDNLVVLDSDAANVGTKIVVGGPAVNSVAKDVFQTAGLELSPSNPKIVKAVDAKTVVIAGYTAEDTRAAVDEFLAALGQ